jgi:hypothetical protein
MIETTCAFGKLIYRHRGNIRMMRWVAATVREFVL